MATSTRIDIDRQRDIDQVRYSSQASLRARMTAVLQAQRRLCLPEPDAAYELRQACVDLASVCELIADELPRPQANERTPAPR